MPKQNLFAKKLKKQFLSINNSLENYFSKINTFKTNFKKNKQNRVFLAFGVLVILTLSYFTLPALYNKDQVKILIKNQILKKYNINLNFNDDLNYGLLPKPHFVSKNVSIKHKEKDIGNIGNFKIFLSIDKFIGFENLVLRDLVFDKTEFNIYFNDLIFFKNLLELEPNENKIIVKNSNIFFRNNNDEVLFINKINNSKFFYDSNNLDNVLSSKNEIFNIPFKLNIESNKFNKELIIKFLSKKIRLNINNLINYEEKEKKGFLEILFVNKNTSLDYLIRENSLIFNSQEDQEKFQGEIYLKPFFFKVGFKYDGLSTKNLFDTDSILYELIRSEILNNKNLSANLNVSVKDITNINELNKLLLKITIQQGQIDISESNIMWKKDLNILLSESFINFNDNGLNLSGKIIFNFKNIDNFYKSFQINKKFRKNIKKIIIDFDYNFESNKVRFNNVKIDGNSNIKLDKYLDEFNSSQKKFDNKIVFKNFINSFFSNYAG